jgi:hypothetical protein
MMDKFWVVYVFDREVEEYTVRHIRTNKGDAETLWADMQARSETKLIGAVVDRTHDSLVRFLLMERLSFVMTPEAIYAIRVEVRKLIMEEERAMRTPYKMADSDEAQCDSVAL